MKQQPEAIIAEVLAASPGFTVLNELFVRDGLFTVVAFESLPGPQADERIRVGEEDGSAGVEESDGSDEDEDDGEALFLAKWHEAIPYMLRDFLQISEQTWAGNVDDNDDGAEDGKKKRVLLAVPISGDDVSLSSQSNATPRLINLTLLLRIINHRS